MATSLNTVPLTGPLLVGIVLEWSLLGALTIQLYTFCVSSAQDKFRLKILVAFTWVWKFLISGWGDPQTFLIVPWQASVWLSGAFTADIIVAISMFLVLRSAQCDAFSIRTQAVIQRLIIRAIETGSITAIAALVVLALFLQFDTNYIYISVAFLLCNLYSNVILANLNGRKTLASGLDENSAVVSLKLSPCESCNRSSRSEADSGEVTFARPYITTEIDVGDEVTEHTNVDLD
ncbi:hypothetical protein GYMLUDRAFT_263619 [Collybiopsis luxurians FD-317 M1]|uniref:DUF6534 domain-containing protein n=1 Tax=Collybiopsis luxurians FD-317 M1 TaxID=944289 RepID=A0A0D0CMS5_9AGAR|nr:hypothetical protein GYMLUDRAFT_263619 [Collybiopsis luxurians FD-317 M1]